MHDRAGLLGDRASACPRPCPGPATVTSPATARARSRYGDGSRQSLARMPSSRSWAAASSGRADERDHLAIALLEQARHDLHAEEARGAGQEDRGFHASTSSRTGVICVPMAWKPPSTWMISAVIAREASESRKLIVSATGAGSSTSHGSGACFSQALGEVAEARDAARGQRGQRPGGHQVHAHAARARGRARGSARWPPARPSRRPSSRRPARRPARRSPGRRSPRPPPGTGPTSPTASAFSENADVWNAVDRALGRRVEEVAAERVAGSERDRVQDAVDAAPALAQVGRDRLDVLGLVDVELEHVGSGVELGRGAIGHALGTTEPGQHDLGPGGLRLLGDLVRDRLAVDDSRDQELLALQVTHSGFILQSGRRARRAGST